MCVAIPKELKMFFWDINDLSIIHIKRNKFFVIERLLNEGDDVSLKWLFETYSEKEIKEVVLNSRRLTIKTALCWQNYFNLRRDEMRCFGTSLTKEELRFLKR